MDKQQPQNKVFVFSKINQKESLQTQFNLGYTLKEALVKGDSYIMILELRNNSVYEEQKQIIDLQRIDLKTDGYEDKVKELLKKGYEVKLNNVSTAILVKYAK